MGKRIFDIAGSLAGLLFLAPILLVIAFVIKLSSPGVVIFRQKRTGRFGKQFTIFKFRTMKMNHGGNNISVRGEARITTIGSYLRKYKLDELPELWNVLIGDMSFVGPRPDMPEYANKLKGEERQILMLRPGITGPASLKYADEEEMLSSVSDPKAYNDEVVWPDKVRINLHYYYNWSFKGDILIIIWTIFGKKCSF